MRQVHDDVPDCGLVGFLLWILGRRGVTKPARHCGEEERFMADRNVFGISMVPMNGKAAAIRSRIAESPVDPSSRFPFPPPDLMQYGESVASHILTGNREYEYVLDVIEQHKIKISKTLDFACSNGRVLRWFDGNKAVSEAWGVDIDSARIAWDLAHFDGKFHFATITTNPYLPFSDGYFDFIFSFSIFTHLDDTWTSWIQELRRLLKKGGHILITLNDESCSRRRMERDDSTGKILKREPDFAAFMKSDGLYSYYMSENGTLFTAVSSELFLKVVSPFFDVIDTREMMDGQTGYLLKRKA
jgi:SAM-dependent methyltransferase